MLFTIMAEKEILVYSSSSISFIDTQEIQDDDVTLSNLSK